MAIRIKKITYQNFRGLPDYECLINGKSFAIFGGNGKGKSAIVDGIEFLFSGQIGRFHGVGSGTLKENEAIANVLGKGIPEVIINSYPTNSKVSRSLTGDCKLSYSKDDVKSYIENHPSVSSFILRRNQILEFICDQDADRYQKFIRLMGIDSIDNMQKSILDAKQRITRKREDKEGEIANRYRMFDDSDTNWYPKTINEIYARIEENTVKLKIIPKDLKDINEIRNLLDNRRQPVTKDRIDKLNNAITRLQTSLPNGIIEKIVVFNNLQKELSDMKKFSKLASKGDVIKAGLKYFEKYPDIDVCPLCEQSLEEGYKAVFDLLKERNDNLSDLREKEETWNNIIDWVIRCLQKIEDQLQIENNDREIYNEENKNAIKEIEKVLTPWLNEIKEIRQKRIPDMISFDVDVICFYSLREAIIKELEINRSELLTTDNILLEYTYNLVNKTLRNKDIIEGDENQHKVLKAIEQKAESLLNAFNKAREYAIELVFDKIGALIIDYYKSLHDFNDGTECSECTSIKLKTTSRASRGGLRLNIDYLDRIKDCDPRMYLSDGHLDSLGLCIYLAAVKTFNTSGSLLVLDDVITSIDKDHRHRIINLLLNNFYEYQIVLTTHDEYWFDKLKSAVNTRGDSSNWKFSNIKRWTVELGPESALYENTSAYILEKLNEQEYHLLGSPLRIVYEDFLKRVAEKLEIKIRYNCAHRFTAGDFKVGGIDNVLRDRLIEKYPNEVEQNRIQDEIVAVFDDKMINILSHDNPEISEVAYPEVKDFVEALASLKGRCGYFKLIKGVTL